MPEVNDDRYDLLKETTDLAYDDSGRYAWKPAKVQGYWRSAVYFAV